MLWNCIFASPANYISLYSVYFASGTRCLWHSVRLALTAMASSCTVCLLSRGSIRPSSQHPILQFTRSWDSYWLSHLPCPPARRAFNQQHHRKETYGSRIRNSFNKTKTEWYSIPVGLGIGVVGAVQFYRIQRRENSSQTNTPSSTVDARLDRTARQRKRPSGPWSVQIMSTLPLKAISRVWGKFNELNIPYYLRIPGFRLYSFVFGVDLSEVGEEDLHTYPNLAKFFYRELKPGVRPLDPDSLSVLSPADGKIIQFGEIKEGQVEQVKGVTYGIDALLGDASAPPSPSEEMIESQAEVEPTEQARQLNSAHEEFASVNGLTYTLPNLFTGPGREQDEAGQAKPADASTSSRSSSEVEVAADLALAAAKNAWYNRLTSSRNTTLMYCVVYLAPGDYHRFHSPVSWVVERRRHFAGELYSVSPWLQRTLPGLFTLNERVVLLGRWRWGFFSMTPVGATNVGSIKINFDRELRTNSLTTDTAADYAAAKAREEGRIYPGYAEATYGAASKVLGGHALKRGEEMGGFQLGSTIVMVFEAPKDSGDGKTGFRWSVESGQKIRYGEAVGRIIDGTP